MNISEATRKILSRYPYIEDYMGRGIINYRALARDIREDVARELGGAVNIQSIVSSVRRHPVSRGRRGNEKVFGILSASEVSLKYDVGTLNVSLNDSSPEMENLLKTGADYIMIRGIETLTVVVPEGLIGTFKEQLKGTVIHSNEGLASVIVKSPEEIAETPGIISHLAGILAAEDINVVEMMSSYTETWFIVSEGDALKTIEAIRREIKRARR